MKRRILSALCCLMLLAAVSITALAVEVPDETHQGSISITMAYQGEAVAGGSLTIYRVAEVYAHNGADYSFRYTDSYANCQVSLDNLSSASTAQALAEYTEKNSISGTKVQIDQKGKVSFQNLELGLYLLIQQDAAEGFEPVNAFLVTMPGRENDHYIYDVDASPKLNLEPAPTVPTEPPTEPSTEPPTEPSTPPKLPQTGLNQWPVPVLAVSGMLCIILGWYLCAYGKKKEHES